MFIQEHKVCALATGSGEYVRCTPIEYNFVDGAFYLFSEGGMKFKGLKDNKNVCLVDLGNCIARRSVEPRR